MDSGQMSWQDLPDVDVILRNGRSLRLRPLRPDDRDRWLEFFYRLSPRTRYLRFQYAKSHVTEEEVTYFTQVSPPERCAYVATVGLGDAEDIVAIGRWDAVPGTKSVEIALAVEDRRQLGGAGTALMEQLAAVALQLGYRQFVAQVLVENTAMQDVFEQSGFQFNKRLEEGIYYYTIDLAVQETYEQRQSYREHVARSAGVRHLLCPRSVAVVGASRDPQKIGGAIFRNLLQGNFTGPVFPVNPGAAAVGGVLAYPSILDVPGDVDLAIIAVAASQVEEVVDQCARKGVWGLVVITAGFGEAGEEGKARERALRDKVHAHGMRLIGPNCLGVLNLDPEVSLSATFSPVVPPSGKVSMGSQSGALGLALLDYADSINLGMAQFVSIGNRVDVSSNDLLEFWEDDPNTDLVLLYLESFGNPGRFSRIARRVSRKKPIIVVKGGRSAAGARAATSHTGALAAADVAVDALFRQAGVIRVNTIEELFGVAQVLAYQPLPKGGRTAIVTNAGGPGILAADACEGTGLLVSPLSEATQRKLRSFLPHDASVTNPVDMIASAGPEEYRKTLSVVLEDPEVDAVLLIYIPPMITRPEEIAAAVREAVSASAQDKPVVTCFMMSRGSPVDLRLGPNRYLPSFVFPEEAVHALARARAFAQRREAPAGHVPAFSDVDVNEARAFVRGALSASGGEQWLLPETALALLDRYGIRVAEEAPATTEEEAAEAARKVGFPVAMKVRSSTIIHKSDVGGVVLGLQSDQDVASAFKEMESRVKTAHPDGGWEGAVLQHMSEGGQEVIIGMTHDPEFGPLVMAGLGGVQVEILKDVAFSLHPLTDLDPDMMLEQLKGLPLLKGWRGRQPRDIAALKETLLRFSALIEDFPEITEIEVNPLMVFDQGGGCLAVDARVRVRPLTR